MPMKDLFEYKRKYEIYRHHAWAGGIILSVLLAIRVLLEISNFSDIPDFIILPLGIILVFYIMISIFFTYRYRLGLTIPQEKEVMNVKEIYNDTEIKKINAKVEKERLKLEKKKAKTETKKQKKINKK
jgi:hypothetical protein